MAELNVHQSALLTDLAFPSVTIRVGRFRPYRFSVELNRGWT
jgi:hypothetical protein